MARSASPWSLWEVLFWVIKTLETAIKDNREKHVIDKMLISDADILRKDNILYLTNPRDMTMWELIACVRNQKPHLQG
ncbi:MAG: hypothetical protein OXC61_04560 [Flavobacteriaceae bacterium]|nr:hypothetical protein [Flavobacteriaceae bacterium]